MKKLLFGILAVVLMTSPASAQNLFTNGVQSGWSLEVGPATATLAVETIESASALHVTVTDGASQSPYPWLRYNNLSLTDGDVRIRVNTTTAYLEYSLDDGSSWIPLDGTP